MFILWRKSVMFHRPRSVKRVSNCWITCGWVRVCAACSWCHFGGVWCDQALCPCRLLGFLTVAAVRTWSRAAITGEVNRFLAGLSLCKRRGMPCSYSASIVSVLIPTFASNTIMMWVGAGSVGVESSCNWPFGIERGG